MITLFRGYEWATSRSLYRLKRAGKVDNQQIYARFVNVAGADGTPSYATFRKYVADGEKYAYLAAAGKRFLCERTGAVRSRSAGSVYLLLLIAHQRKSYEVSRLPWKHIRGIAQNLRRPKGKCVPSVPAR